MIPLLSGEVGPVPTALKTEPSLFKNNIPQNEGNSNKTEVPHDGFEFTEEIPK